MAVCQPPVQPTTTARVPVVESDGPTAATALRSLIRAGFAVEVSTSGSQAMSRVEESWADLVVLNPRLPGDDGSAFQRMRACSDVPVIMISPRGDDHERTWGLNLGADDFVPNRCRPRSWWRGSAAFSGGCTRHRPKTKMRLHVYPALGHRPIAAVRTSEIQALVHRLAERLAPSTIEVVYGRVVAAFSGGRARSGHHDESVHQHPAPVQAPASMLEVLSTDQVHAIAESIAPRYAALVLPAAGTGLRPGELFGLRTDRIDFLRRTVRVDQQVARLRVGGVGLAPLKTQASYRSVPLPETVADAIASHLARWEAHADTGVMFTNERGGLIQDHPFSAAWRTAKRRAAAPGWATPHDLRHYLRTASSRVQTASRRAIELIKALERPIPLKCRSRA